MGVVTGIVVFVITWVIVFLMLLPCWVTHHGVVVRGVDPGAPDNPHLRPKVTLATIITILIWIFIDWYVG